MKKQVFTLCLLALCYVSTRAQTSNTHLDTSFQLCTQITDLNTHYTNYPTPTPRNFNKLLVLPDDKILASGSSQATFGSDRHKFLLRLNSNGSIDNSFQFFVNDYASNQWAIATKVMAINGGNHYLVAGSFSQDPGTMLQVKGIYRINTDGTEDTAFDAPLIEGTGVDMNGDPAAGASAIYDMDVLANGNIIVGGNFLTFGSDSIQHLALLNPDGSLNHSFSSPLTTFVNDRVFRVKALPDDKILVVTSNSTRILKANGDMDTTATLNFGHYSSHSHCIAIQPDGKIIMAGRFISLPGPSGSVKIARFHSDFTRDTTFTILAGNALANNIRLQPDGKILLSGPFTELGGETRRGLARLNADGTLDQSLDPGSTGFTGTGQVYDADLQSDGKILVHHSHTHHQGHILQNSNVTCFVIRLQGGGDTPISVSEQLREISFRVYPNPAVGEVILDLREAGVDPAGASVTVIDMQGRVVWQKTLGGSLSRLDLSALTPGMYYVRIDLPYSSPVRKLILQ